MSRFSAEKAFTLVEMLVTIAIIGVLATVMTVSLFSARKLANDRVRIATVNQIGRFMLASDCYAPSGGPGEYDLRQMYDEIVAARPEVKTMLSAPPKDPSSGTATQTNYRYAYDASKHCALYVNLQDANAKATLTNSAPEPGGGTGTFQGPPGPNGTDRWYQIAR